MLLNVIFASSRYLWVAAVPSLVRSAPSNLTNPAILSASWELKVSIGRYQMKDNKQTDLVYRKIMAQKTGEERMLMGFSMLNFARRIVLSSMGKDIPPEECRRKLFLRFYGNDFSLEEREKILQRLAK